MAEISTNVSRNGNLPWPNNTSSGHGAIGRHLELPVPTEKSGNNARPLLDTRFLDVARVAVYRADFFESERARLITLVTQSYIDGELQLPGDGADVDINKLIEDFVDEELATHILHLESGPDKVMFNEQLQTMDSLRAQALDAEDRARKQRIKNTEARSAMYEARNYLSTLLTEEQLVAFDAKVGISTPRPLQPVETTEEPSDALSVDNEYRRVVGSNWALGWLERIHLVRTKPPHSTEVAIVTQVDTNAIN